MLRLTDKVGDNLIFQDIDEATRQLIRNDNYVPDDKESIERIVGSIEGVKLSDLDLTEGSDTYSYFQIDTSSYDSLNGAQRLLAEKAYGAGDDFKASMKMLNDASIKDTRFYVTNPKYVEKHVEGDSALVRACRLFDFDYISYFNAVGGLVDYCDVGLRGVRKVSPEADARNLEDSKSYSPSSAVSYLLEDKERSIGGMSSDDALGLLNLATQYLNQNK